MKNIIKNNKALFLRLFLFSAIVAWCTFIFCMSAEPADISADRSEGLTKKIIDTVLYVFGLDGESYPALADTFHGILRKLAHMFSYFVLAVLTLCFSFTFDKLKVYAKILVSGAFTLIYALSDEIHQIYVDGRAGRIHDVLVDMIGACIGFFIVLLFRYFIFRRKRRKKISKKR